LKTHILCYHFVRFRFLTPASVATAEPALSDVARQAGANPISLPTENPSSALNNTSGGETSPTGVTELALYPSWVDAKDMPNWYAKGADVDALLDVGDDLDWLADTGDLNENFQPSPVTQPVDDSIVDEVADGKMMGVDMDDSMAHNNTVASLPMNSASACSLPRVSSDVEAVVPPLPSIFDKAPNADSLEDDDDDLKEELPLASLPLASLSTDNLHLSINGDGIHDDPDDLQVFDNAMEEHDFVSTILEDHHDDVEGLVMQES
jgi:hypothetical protein